MFLKKSIFGLIIAVIFWSCIEEDLDLVNAPPQSKSVRVRLINFAEDKLERKLSLDGKVETASVAYSYCSDAIVPPADSSVPSILLNGSEEYRLPRKLRFSSENNYTVFAFKAFFPDSIPPTGKGADSIIVVTSLSNYSLREGYAYLRVINAVRDDSITYQMRLGCPNGSLIGSVKYMQTSAQTEVLSDGVAISLLKTTKAGTEVIGLFNLNLEEKKQFLLVISKEGGEEKFQLLDELSEKAVFLEQFKDPSENFTTNIRCINLSSDNQTFFKSPDIILNAGVIADLNAKAISNSKSVQACNDGGTLDTLAIIKGSDTLSIINTSLNISEKYSLITIDSAGLSGSSLLLVEPYRMSSYDIIDKKDKALVRVVNAAYGKENLTISLAANSYSNTRDSLNYRSGEMLAQKIQPGIISNPVRVTPGNDLPITLFTSGEPAFLEYTALANLEKNKKYLLIVDYDNAIKDYKIYLIDEENTTAGNLEPLQKGVFAQFINVIPGVNISNLTVGNILKDVKLYYGSSIATVLNPGNHTIRINGRDTTINASVDERVFIVFAGDKSNPDLITNNSKISSLKLDELKSDKKVFYRRFLNASDSIPLLNIKTDTTDNASFFAEGLAYRNIKNEPVKTIEGNATFVFYNYTTTNLLYRVDDIPFTFRKRFTVIFGGRPPENPKEQSSFIVVVQQEY